MAISVDVMKDPLKIKKKVILNFTKRQAICFGSAIAVGIPLYIFTKRAIGTDMAALLMVGSMMPFFFVALYEKNGLYPEQIIRQIIRLKVLTPGIRKYRVENIYDKLREKEEIEKEVEQLEEKARRYKEEKRRAAEKKYQTFKKE